jgi:hypothetical protein
VRLHMQKSREGFAILVVVIGVLVLSTVTMTALDMGSQGSRSARATRVSASALYTAEAGVAIVSANWPTATIGMGDSLNLGWTTLGNGSRYHAWIHRRDVGFSRVQIYSLTVEGWGPGPAGGQATVQTWATRFTTGLFEAGIAAKGDIFLNGGTFIDSYDSRLGVYAALLEDGSANTGTEGDVQANGSIDMTDQPQIRGDATAGGTIDGQVTGDMHPNASPLPYPVEQCPPYSPSSSFPSSMYRLQNGKWSLGISGTHGVNTGTYSVHEFNMSSDAVLIIPPDNSVTIYISGRVQINAQAEINNQTLNARNLSFVSCNRTGLPANGSDWLIAGGPAAYFTVYAPNNDVKVGGSGDIYGAVVANDFSTVGGASLHYDVSLGESSAVSAIMPRSWKQLLR